MNRSLAFLLLPLILVGCGTSGTLSKSDKYSMEMTLHKTRSDLEEVKHDLHTQRMESNIIEGKIVNQEDSIASLKKDTFDLHQSKLESFAAQIRSLEKRLTAFETNQDGLRETQGKLQHTTSEMHKAISQSKDRINEMERVIALQSKSMSEVAKLKRSVDKVNQFVESGFKEISIEPYHVKAGEQLDEIAKIFGTTTETLQKINRLESDHLIVGQELTVPILSPPLQNGQ